MAQKGLSIPPKDFGNLKVGSLSLAKPGKNISLEPHLFKNTSSSKTEQPAQCWYFQSKTHIKATSSFPQTQHCFWRLQPIVTFTFHNEDVRTAFLWESRSSSHVQETTPLNYRWVSQHRVASTFCPKNIIHPSARKFNVTSGFYWCLRWVQKFVCEKNQPVILVLTFRF